MNKLLVAVLIVIIAVTIWMHGGHSLYQSLTSPEPVTEAQAVVDVQNLSEVAQYVAEIKAAGGDPRVTADGTLQRVDGSLDTYWQVKVYEYFSDHTVPDSVYDVNSKTGLVTEEASY